MNVVIVWEYHISIIAGKARELHRIFFRSRGQIVQNGHQQGCQENAENLEPVKERDTNQFWLYLVIETGPEGQDKGQQQEPEQPRAISSF
jgi:hypothetical protein